MAKLMEQRRTEKTRANIIREPSLSEEGMEGGN